MLRHVAGAQLPPPSRSLPWQAPPPLWELLGPPDTARAALLAYLQRPSTRLSRAGSEADSESAAEADAESGSEADGTRSLPPAKVNANRMHRLRKRLQQLAGWGVISLQQRDDKVRGGPGATAAQHSEGLPSPCTRHALQRKAPHPVARLMGPAPALAPQEAELRVVAREVLERRSAAAPGSGPAAMELNAQLLQPPERVAVRGVVVLTRGLCAPGGGSMHGTRLASSPAHLSSRRPGARPCSCPDRLGW